MKKINILLGSLLAFVTLMVALPGGSVSAAPIDSQSSLAAASVREYTTSQGAVTITFDDGYQSQYDIAYPVMNQYGFKGTLFVITGIVNSSGILNLQEIQEMHSHGWEIDSHTVTHPYLTQLSQSQLEAELANSKSWIVNNSLGGSIALAYPYGNYDGNVASTASKYYRYARTTTPGINDFSTSNVVLYNVPLWGSSSYNSLSSAEQLVSNAISQNKWAVVMAHGVTDNQSDSRLNSNDGWCTTTVFTSFLTFLKNANVPIKNFAEISANSAPVAVNDTYSVLKNTVLTVAAAIGVLNNDTDADGDTLTAIKVTDPAHGTLTFNSNGSFTYTPTTSYTGSDSFTYKANDGKADSNTATVSITITASTATTFGLNSGDNTWNESANLLDVMRFQNNASTGMLTKLEVLFDDTTPNGKVRLGVYADSSGVPGSRLLDAGEVTVANGWVSISGLSLPVAQNTYYWLACDLQSANGLRYQSASGLHYWASSTYGALPVQFTLNNAGYNDCLYVMRATVNAAPVAVNDAYKASKNTALTVAAATGVLSNDTDADGDTLTATKLTDPAHGTLTFNSDGSFTYTPTTGYTGSDSFTYKANDGKSDSNTATVTITVTAVNHAPVAVNDAYTTSENTA
ncbi:MAG: Ig-like domain-containing protein, partial [Dehalococcoidia bacterium]